MWFPKLWRKSVDPAAKAAEIKARHAKKQMQQGLFTPSQEVLMEELGLKPGVKLEKNTIREKKTKARDPLTERQRNLAKELGLLKPDEN